MAIISPDSKIPLEAIMCLIDWQVPHYEGEDRQALIRACNTIYEHLHKDDPEPDESYAFVESSMEKRGDTQ